MKKIISIAFSVLLMAILFSACSQPGESPSGSDRATNEAAPGSQAESLQSAVEPEEIKPIEPNEAPERNANILIVYYSLTGTTESIATLLHEKTGGVLYLLEPETPYSDATAAAEVEDEKTRGEIRGLQGQLPDVTAYELILVGGPVWSGVPANPVQKYLSLTDFGGAKVAGFWTANAHPGNYADSFNALITNAEIIDGLSLIGADISDTAELNLRIDSWLASLGISE